MNRRYMIEDAKEPGKTHEEKLFAKLVDFNAILILI